MTQPTPQQLAQRFHFSAQLLAELAAAIRANLADQRDSPVKSRLTATCQELDEISCVHWQGAVHFTKKEKKGCKQPLSAASGTTPEAASHA